MTNRRLDAEELAIANRLLADVRRGIEASAGDDRALAWALRRKVHKELAYDERTKPMRRKLLKMALRIKQGNKCALCATDLLDRGPVLDRIETMLGYTEGNTRLLCPSCDSSVQEKRGYS